MSTFRLVLTIAVLVMAVAGRVNAASPQPNGQAFSPAIGLAIWQLQAAYPSFDCSDKMCDFGRNQTPQPLCPGAGPCDQLTLFIGSNRVIGYSANFSREDWTRSLGASIAAWGTPQKRTVGPGNFVKMQNDYWSWQMTKGLELTYTATSGVDAYGAPLDIHNIMLSPAGAN